MKTNKGEKPSACKLAPMARYDDAALDPGPCTECGAFSATAAQREEGENEGEPCKPGCRSLQPQTPKGRDYEALMLNGYGSHRSTERARTEEHGRR